MKDASTSLPKTKRLRLRDRSKNNTQTGREMGEILISLLLFYKYKRKGVLFMKKGGEFERDISKFLTKWLTGKHKPYMFWRQDASGGMATVHIENIHMTGDIKHLHPDSKFFTDLFSIECKNGYPKTSTWQHFTKMQFNIEDFWKQALDDSEKSNKQPMLIYKKKGRRAIVGINKYVEEILSKQIWRLNHITIGWGRQHENCQNPRFDCVLYDMKDFFKNVKPDDIKRLKQTIEDDY